MSETNANDGNNVTGLMAFGPMTSLEEPEVPGLWRPLDRDTSAMEIPGKGVVLRMQAELGLAALHLPFVHLNAYKADGSLISEHAPESEKEKAVSWKLS